MSAYTARSGSTRITVARNGTAGWCVTWRRFPGDPRQRESFGVKALAVERADEIARQLAAGRGDTLTLTSAERDAYRAAQQALAGIPLLAAIELVAATETRRTSVRGIERLGEKVAAQTGQAVDNARPLTAGLYHGSFKQFFNKAEREITGRPDQARRLLALARGRAGAGEEAQRSQPTNVGERGGDLPQSGREGDRLSSTSDNILHASDPATATEEARIEAERDQILGPVEEKTTEYPGGQAGLSRDLYNRYNRAALVDKGKSDGYWSRIIERAARSFENFLIAEMQLKGYHNDYLANVTSVEEFARDKGRYPYLLPAEVAPVAKAFNDLFSTMKTRETEQGLALYASDPRRNLDMAAERGRMEGDANSCTNSGQYEGAPITTRRGDAGDAGALGEGAGTGGGTLGGEDAERAGGGAAGDGRSGQAGGGSGRQQVEQPGHLHQRRIDTAIQESSTRHPGAVHEVADDAFMRRYPNTLAAAVDGRIVRTGRDLRKYAQAMWRVMQAVNPDLPEVPDWNTHSMASSCLRLTRRRRVLTCELGWPKVCPMSATPSPDSQVRWPDREWLRRQPAQLPEPLLSCMTGLLPRLQRMNAREGARWLKAAPPVMFLAQASEQRAGFQEAFREVLQNWVREMPTLRRHALVRQFV